jgi:hypothetical protein
MSIREVLRAHGAWAVLLAALVLPPYAHLLAGDEAALGRDYGKLFADVIEQQRRAWSDGELLLWDPSQLGGTTAWGLPNEASFYPPLVALVRLRGTVAGLNTCIVLHVLWGALGTYALAFTLCRRRFAALVAGVLFGYAHFTQHLAYILPLELLASAWIPWTLVLLVRALEGRRWVRATALAALAYSVVPWVGGFIQFLPGLLVAGVVVLAGALRRPLRPHLLRAAAVLAVFGTLMVLLALGKLLPVLEWSKLTDRAGGITREFALGGSLSPSEMLDFARQEGVLPWLLAAAGVALALRRRFDWVLPLAAAVALLVLMSGRVVYGFLYDTVPGFDHVREPRRVWLVMAAVLPAAAALGVARLQDVLAGRLLASRTLRLVGAALVLGALAADRLHFTRYDRPALSSLAERVAANAIHHDLARRAQEEPRFRVVELERARPRVKQTGELMHSVFGLEGLEGILGNVSLTDYDLGYLAEVKFSPARALGVLNARYVLSAKPLDVEGLDLVGRFDEDRGRPYAGFDGPWLYRDTLALPRAALLDHAFLQVGGDAYQRRLLLNSPRWSPQSAVLVEVAPREAAAIGTDELARFDLALASDGAEPPGFAARCDEARLPRHVLGALDDQGLAAIALPASPLRALPDPPREWNALRVELPADAVTRPGWLLLAETFAHYPGWSAEVDGRAARLWRADGIATAIAVPAGARAVRLRYVPPGFVAGLAGSGLGLLACVAVLVRRRG